MDFKREFTAEEYVMQCLLAPGKHVIDYTPLHGFTDLDPRSI
jgi:hypothetical protein